MPLLTAALQHRSFVTRSMPRYWERSSPQSREVRPAEPEELALDLASKALEVCFWEGCSAGESRHHALGEGPAPQAPHAPAAASPALGGSTGQLCVSGIFLGFGMAFTSGLPLALDVGPLEPLWLWCPCGAVNRPFHTVLASSMRPTTNAARLQEHDASMPISIGVSFGGVFARLVGNT